jgi:hypothetical protein
MRARAVCVPLASRAGVPSLWRQQGAVPPTGCNSRACAHGAVARALTCPLRAQSIDWRTQPPPRRIPGNTKHDQGKIFELPRTWNETTDSCWDETQVRSRPAARGSSSPLLWARPLPHSQMLNAVAKRSSLAGAGLAIHRWGIER